MVDSLTIRRLDSTESEFKTSLQQLLKRDQAAEDPVDEAVAAIIAKVRTEGDSALFDYTREFDSFDVDAKSLEVSPARMQQALDAIPQDQREALEYAAGRIRSYHEHQLQRSWQYTEPDGTMLGQ